MDAQQFLAEFGHITNAPGGIRKLRALILQLAVQGRLIAFTTSDASSRVLLSEVRSIKAGLISDKKLPREKPFPEVSQQEIAADAPPHWEWARFGEVWQLLSGRDLAPSQYNDSNHGIPYITGASNFECGVISINRWTSAPVVVSITGDLLITCKGTIGKTAFNTLGEIHIARQIMAIRNFSGKLNTGFLKIWLDGFVGQLVEKSKSMIPGFSRDDLILAAYPVLPVEEQSRIVVKVDELMSLCDKLEAQQQDRRKLQNNLRQTTLQAVSSATSPHELQTTWARLAENLGKLLYVPEDVSEIKALILDLAIQGLLTDRQLNDQPAEALISRSLEAKRMRLASGEMKNKKPSATDIVDVEINIPAHWKRVSLDELFQFIDYRGKTPVKTSSGVVLVTAKNVRPGFIAVEPVEYLSESSYQAWMTRGFPRVGDLLITTEAPLGNVARIEEQPSFALAQRVIDLQPFADLNTKCAMYFMMSPLFQSLLEENSTGMTAKGIKAGKLKQLLLPVPPKEEQQRIVQRVEELMNICSVLSSQLEAARNQSTRLAAASVSSLTGIAIEQEEESMKAPQTELIALLRLGTTPDIKAQAPLATILARHNGEMSAKDLWQRFGSEIDAFYAQLKAEVAHGWILEPVPAEMREKAADTASA
ncbi:restriction endonuclease subunit S [Pseudoduganella sp. GCM10020061]|uniref:restriction endonuclease subunit S n=1 Tax=Pseudoduganella sp. GCM10020061 TaxID=3317345 RepID=UPI00363F11AA